MIKIPKIPVLLILVIIIIYFLLTRSSFSAMSNTMSINNISNYPLSVTNYQNHSITLIQPNSSNSTPIPFDNTSSFTLIFSGINSIPGQIIFNNIPIYPTNSNAPGNTYTSSNTFDNTSYIFSVTSGNNIIPGGSTQFGTSYSSSDQYYPIISLISALLITPDGPIISTVMQGPDGLVLDCTSQIAAQQQTEQSKCTSQLAAQQQINQSNYLQLIEDNKNNKQINFYNIINKSQKPAKITITSTPPTPGFPTQTISIARKASVNYIPLINFIKLKLITDTNTIKNMIILPIKIYSQESPPKNIIIAENGMFETFY